MTLAADRTTLTGVVHQGEASLSFETTRSLVGNTLTVKQRGSDGEQREDPFDLPRHSSDDGTIGTFSGYLCGD
jgi:hypothetical protein